MNWRITLLALIFGVIETAYFGWNFLPQSPAELICDGITLVLFALSYVRLAPQKDGGNGA